LPAPPAPSVPPTPRFAANSAALGAVDWSTFRKTLVAFAYSLCRNRAMADDLAQEAVRRLLAAATEWDAGAEPDPLRFAMGAVKSILWGERTSDYARKSVPLDPSAKNEPPDESLHPPDPRALTEDRFADLDLFSRRLAFARNHLAAKADAEALEMLELAIAGVDAPADILARTGRPLEALKDVLAARKRLQRAAEAAAQAIPDDPPSSPDTSDESDHDSMEVA
jgi:DNA-directed RNA polymerase specialized sigma24 family protein